MLDRIGWWIAFLTTAFIAAFALAEYARAQQRTLYDGHGNAVGHESFDSQGTRTIYDRTGRRITQETKDGTIYHAPSGKIIGKTDPSKPR